jgi:RNA polymerase sigma factor (sigma-70 family)
MTPALIRSNQAKAEPPSRDALILSYLKHVDGLLRKYAASTKMDYEDLRQDACIVIMHCLDRKPDQQEILHGYVTVSVRNRIIDKIRYNQCRRAASLDALSDACSDRLKVGEREPDDALVAREEFQALCASLFTGLARPLKSDTRRKYRELAETALASLTPESEEITLEGGRA